MSRSDFSYVFDGVLYALYANNAQAAANLSRLMDANAGSNKLLPAEFVQFKSMAKAAGYSVRKNIENKMSDDEILAELAV